MVTTKGQRPAIKNNKLSTLLDKNISYEAVKVELITEVKESKGESKMLGAIVLFPGVVKSADGKTEDRKHWISFDNLFTTDQKGLFAKFYDNATATFLGLANVGVKAGQPYLANA